MTDPDILLPQRQYDALLALLAHPTIGQAAAACDTSERQIHRWLKEPAFTAAYAEARSQLVQHTIATLQGSGPAAAQVLHDIANDETQSGAVRVRAAHAIIMLMFRASELDDFEQRLAELERRLREV